MFFAGEEGFIVCKTCREMTRENNIYCQNCRRKLVSTQRRNNIRNRSSELNNLLNVDNRNKTKNHKIPKEKLNPKRMDYELYNKNIDEKNEPPICCICQDCINYQEWIFILSCNHIFHKTCLNKWFERKYECPYCRKEFRIEY